jgi:predicted ATPase
MMHGSCIEHPKGAIVFAGVSGAGKSTLAAHFSRRGFPILSDDGLQLKQEKGKITVIPTYPGLRLWDDSFAELFDGALSSEPMAHYSSKKRIESEKFLHSEELPAMCLFFIRPQIPGDLLSITRIVNRKAFFELNKQIFILDPFSREKAISRINVVAELVSRLPMYELGISHNYSMLDQIQMNVLDLVETL